MASRNTFIYNDTIAYGNYFKEYLVDSPKLFRVPENIYGKEQGCCVPCFSVVAYPCVRGLLRSYAKGNYRYVVCFECPKPMHLCTPTWECIKFGGNINMDTNALIDSSEEEETEDDDLEDVELEIPFIKSKPPLYSRHMCSFDYNIFVLSGVKRARYYANRNMLCGLCYCIPCHAFLLANKLHTLFLIDSHTVTERQMTGLL